MKSDFVASFIWNEEKRLFEKAVYLNMDPANLANYEAYYQFHDPITPALQRRRRATLVREVMPQKELEKTEFFNDFLMKDGLHHGINVYAYDGDLNIGDLRIWRTRRRPEFGRREKALLEFIKPHFRNALRNAVAMRRTRRQAGILSQIWEQTQMASFLFDPAGRLIHANQAAGRLKETLPVPLFSSFMEHVHSMARNDLSGADWGPFFLSVLKVEDPTHGTRLTAVQAYNYRASKLDPAWLSARHGLTKREAQVCLLTAKGLTDNEIARTLGISFYTVRAHLKNIFFKLQVTNRTELLHSLLEDLVDISF
ncbi:MAG: helix-turn-helix transcriptional regulator [Thermodesulfobacteriota bacterium]